MSGVEALRDAQVAAAQIEEVGRRVADLVTPRNDEDLDGLVHSQAVAQTQAIAAEAEAVQAAWTSAYDEITAIRDAARAGTISSEQAVRRLADARRALPLLTSRTASIGATYESATAALKDPAARRAALLAKYPSLRG